MANPWSVAEQLSLDAAIAANPRSEGTALTTTFSAFFYSSPKRETQAFSLRVAWRSSHMTTEWFARFAWG